MATLSVPFNKTQENFIKSLVKSGKAASKAHAVRLAIDKMAEDEALLSLREAEADIQAGRVYYGDLDELLKKHA